MVFHNGPPIKKGNFFAASLTKIPGLGKSGNKKFGSCLFILKNNNYDNNLSETLKKDIIKTLWKFFFFFKWFMNIINFLIDVMLIFRRDRTTRNFMETKLLENTGTLTFSSQRFENWKKSPQKTWHLLARFVDQRYIL